MPVLIDDLDDIEALHSADRDGLLHSAALAGAQVRAVAEAQSEGVLAALGDLRPRAVVIVTGGDLPTTGAADLVVATCAARIDVPVVVVPSLPGWIGPLDVVVVAGSDAGDPLLSNALTRAARRRADVVVLAPLEGPLREAAGIGRRGAVPVIDLSPRLNVDPRFGFTGLVAGLVAVLTALTAVRLTPAPPALHDVADLLDAEAAADHPGRETFHNQAKMLAARVAGHRGVWAGDTAAASAVARRACAAFFEIAGRPAAHANEGRALAVFADHGGPTTTGAAVDSIFYDPEFDGPPAADPMRLFLVSTAARAPLTRQRLGARDVDLVTEDSGDDPARRPGGEPQGSFPSAPGALEALADTPADLAGLLVVVVRVQSAAAYLALAAAEPDRGGGFGETRSWGAR
ncbi:MAG: hypothetical protein QM809_09340 [Gordonia sp. (in: high G+C Gram-positive bacteria)]|uniref:hypothetical protein n=1 Tax=Gordonia sp. (in: high G+C Gram-positive bacteria) TaxID=84139 RepID=UPI0039E6D0B3